MALDPTKVANKSSALVAKRTSAFEDVAADLNLAVLRLDETCPDPETAKQWARVAAAVLRGDDTQVRTAMFDSFTEEQKRLFQLVLTDQITESNLEQLRQQSQQPAAPQQPQVVQGTVVTTPQELTNAVSASKSKADAAATAAAEAKTAAQKAYEAAERVTGFGQKEAKATANEAKSKADASATAAAEAKTAANEALAKLNAAGSGNAAPTAALPVAGTP